MAKTLSRAARTRRDPSHPIEPAGITSVALADDGDVAAGFPPGTVVWVEGRVSSRPPILRQTMGIVLQETDEDGDAVLVQWAGASGPTLCNPRHLNKASADTVQFFAGTLAVCARLTIEEGVVRMPRRRIKGLGVSSRGVGKKG